MKALCVLSILLVCVIWSGSCLHAHSNLSEYYLFTEMSPTLTEVLSSNHNQPEFLVNSINAEKDKAQPDYDILRYREVTITSDLTTMDKVRKDDVLILNLFDDTQYRARIDRVSMNINNTVTIRARINNYALGYIILSTTDDLSMATIKIPENEEFYLVKSDPKTRQHYILDIGDERNYIESGPPQLPPEIDPDSRQRIDEGRESMPDRSLGPNDPAIIDVMIVYTPAAANWANIRGGIKNVIAQTIGNSQLVHDNSGTLVELFLVRSSEIEYQEADNAVTDLYRLTFRENWDPWGYEDGPPWYMEEVHDWRNDWGADLVSLLALVEDVGGIAWQLTTTNGNANMGFSLTRVQQASHTYTFVHELGHNMGAHHHRDQNFQPGPGLYNYSAGSRWTGNDERRYCSVMTYQSGNYFDDGNNHTRVAYFSNPNIYHQGVPAGHRINADNTRGIREIKHVVAGYRSSPWDVSGRITGTNSPNGLEGAIITLISEDDVYTTESGSFGNFYFEDVYGTLNGIEYELTVTRDGYQNYVGQATVKRRSLRVGTIVLKEAWPVRNITASLNEEEDTINLTWDKPDLLTHSEQWISWDSGQNENDFGFDNQAQFIAAVRFTPENIIELEVDNFYLTAIRFFPSEQASYTIKVYRGGSNSPLNPGQEVLSQVVTNIVADQWNEVILDNPVQIFPNQEIWFGYHVNTQDGFPAGCDDGPGIDYSGNIIFYNNEWTTITDIDEDSDFNWNIQGFAGLNYGDRSIALNPDAHNQSRKHITNNRSRQQLNSRQLAGYNIFRINHRDVDNPDNWTYLETITDTVYADSSWIDLEDGYWGYAIQALYGEEIYSYNSYSNFIFKGFGGGEGTNNNPWKIASAEHLNNIRLLSGNNYTNKHFIQTENIDLGVPPWNEGHGWLPIGNSNNRFSGIYDGSNYLIQGMVINRDNQNHQGLFSYTNGALIVNVGLIDVKITSRHSSGSLVGVASNSSIVSNSFSTGNINGNSILGGLIGCIYANSIVINSYSKTNINGDTQIGGLVGVALDNSVIRNSFSVGSISGNSDLGGLIARIEESTVNNSYWDKVTSEQTTSAGGEGKTTAEMTYPYADDLYVNWSFGGVWRADVNLNINNGYPALLWYKTPYPNFALNPIPKTGSINVETTLDKLNWSYVSDPAYSDPLGFRVYLDTEGDFNDDNYEWVPYIAGQDDYYSSDIIPDKLARFTTYYWQVIPTTTKPDDNGRTNKGHRNTNTRTLATNIEKDDAINSPIWSFRTTAYDQPKTAINPMPADDSTGVTVELETLSWSYVADSSFTNPLGFRVYFNKNGEFEEDDDFLWIPYIEDQEDYSCYDILPETLLFATIYYWQVVPTTIDPEYNIMDNKLRNKSANERTSLQPSHDRGDAESCPIWSFTTKIDTSTESLEPTITTNLQRSYPNPFNPQTVIGFSIAKQDKVIIDVYNIKGQKIINLVDDYYEIGNYNVVWNGVDNNNQQVGSGIYFYRMITGDYNSVKRMILVK